jgi:hypothetical protein
MLANTIFLSARLKMPVKFTFGMELILTLQISTNSIINHEKFI